MDREKLMKRTQDVVGLGTERLKPQRSGDSHGQNLQQESLEVFSFLVRV